MCLCFAPPTLVAGSLNLVTAGTCVKLRRITFDMGKIIWRKPETSPMTAGIFSRRMQFGLAQFCVAIGMIFLSAAAGAQTPATLTDLGTTAPTPGADDISQFSTTGQADKPDGLNYYTDNQSN